MVLTSERELMLQNGLHDFFLCLVHDGGLPPHIPQLHSGILAFR
jgi:hypothetical protein